MATGRTPNQDTAVDLLAEQPERIEPGLAVLESRLPLGEDVIVDVLMRDALGYPVAALFSDGEVSRDLARMASVTEAMHGGRYLLQRLFGDKGLDPSQRPRFVLLAPRFPDNAPALLDMMAQVEIQAVEFRVVKSSVGRALLDLQSFHRTAGPGLAFSRTARVRTEERPAPPPAPAPKAAPAKAPEPEPEPIELLDETDWTKRARDAITALSPRVAESKSGSRFEYRVDDKLLATVQSDKRGLHLQVGDKSGKGPVVGDEEVFNRQLDAIFDLFFNQLSPDRA